METNILFEHNNLETNILLICSQDKQLPRYRSHEVDQEPSFKVCLKDVFDVRYDDSVIVNEGCNAGEKHVKYEKNLTHQRELKMGY